MFVFLSGKTVLSLHVWYSSTTKNKTIILNNNKTTSATSILCCMFTSLIHETLGSIENHLEPLKYTWNLWKALEIHLKPSKPFETFEIHLKLKYTWNLRKTIWNYYGNEDPVAAFVHIQLFCRRTSPFCTAILLPRLLIFTFYLKFKIATEITWNESSYFVF